ncbi:MAG: serine/threonine protein kinase [Planctomycetes bacterium]|nr:serine/threonine protein kinase [Planctomycetota bacterium]
MDESPTPPPDDERTRRIDAAEEGRTAAAPRPARIGSYRIVRLLGEGGMGAVYEAEQDSPRRTVALKVIRPGHVSAAMLSRFEHEAQVLGRLQHPGIAQIHEAGTVEDAGGVRLPFFAMELVRGDELDAYAERRSLGTRERLELLARVCDAVSHAHQKGVIHRDLKPGNILVDETGQPKILDFGVARATDADMRRTTMRTDIGELIGTIPYMSPEQVSGDPAQLDTRSDVYALGVVAFELLAGRMPYDLQKRMIHDALRVIREDEPARLSSVDRALRGDVETIVGKAPEKDKARRYASAEALAGDIRRYLANEPISARPASTWYQATKFARRHKGLVAGLAVAMLLLVVGLLGVGIAWREAVAAGEREVSARRAAQQSEQTAIAARAQEEQQRVAAERQRKLAETERDKAKVIAEFMAGVFWGFDDQIAFGRDTELLVVLMDRAVQRIERGELAGTPEAELYLRTEIAPMYLHLAKPDTTRLLIEPALPALRARSGEPVALARSLSALASALQQRGDGRGALAHATEAVEIYERHAAEDRVDFAVVLGQVGEFAMGLADFTTAEPAQRRAVEMWRRLAPGGSTKLARSIHGLGMIHLRQGDREGAEVLLREAHEMALRLDPDGSPSTVVIGNALGQALQQNAKLGEAEQLFRQALTTQRRLRRGDHELTAGAINSLASVLVQRRAFEEAEPLAREALAMLQRLFPDEHLSVAMQRNNLAHLLHQKGDLDGAEPLFRDSLASFQRILPGDHPTLLAGLHNLGCLLQAKKDFAAAEQMFRDVLARTQRLLPKGHPNMAQTMFSLATTLRDAGDLEQAEAVHREALAMRRGLFPKGHVSVVNSLQALGELLVRRGDRSAAEAMFAEAKELRAKLGAKPR